MILHKELTIRAAAYVTQLFEQHTNTDLIFHNITHTQNVVQRTLEIAEEYLLNTTHLFIVTVAAWFHDTGHLFVPAKDHEVKSVSIMKTWMEEQQDDRGMFEYIERCILSTKLPSRPTSLLENIICDADNYHLGTEEFLQSDQQVKSEYEARNNETHPGWARSTLCLMESHKYFTLYCRNLLGKGKEKNIILVRETCSFQ